MNIYNKLFVLEYTRSPDHNGSSKIWRLNLSNHICYVFHRDFDLYSYVDSTFKMWYIYGKRKRTIYPSLIVGGNEYLPF